MKRTISLALATLLLLCAQQVFAIGAIQSQVIQMPGFTIHQLGTGSGPTLLVIGGIQGDEPGGFSAASLLTTHYIFKKGTVWVVPNLNFPSIIQSSRGLHGDMNRKFAKLSQRDPEYETVRRIQSLILQPQVDLVLNMHDGSGFYRPNWINSLQNQNRWGQCIVIDQKMVDLEVLQNPRYQNMHSIATQVTKHVNSKLLNKRDAYHIKNTKTKNFDREMEKTLSYFAVCNGKAAFGLEASKELPPSIRSYYHVCLLEGFMQAMGIEFERNFDLSPQGVLTALNEGVFISMHNNRFYLPLDNIREVTAGYLPVNSKQFEITSSNPLLALLPGNKSWKLVYGSNTLTSFKPALMEFDSSLEQVSLQVDGKKITSQLGGMIQVKDSFLVEGIEGFRVNAIGARKEINGSECNILLERKHFEDKFSLDKDGNVFRVEIYKDNAFCGMLLVNFGSEKSPAISNRPLTAGIENNNSNLGR